VDQICAAIASVKMLAALGIDPQIPPITQMKKRPGFRPARPGIVVSGVWESVSSA
jgi:hypothetical protein